MESLDDDRLLASFPQMTLEDVSKLKQVDKQFNETAAFANINQTLIIFDRMPPVALKFKFTEEFWKLEDTVYVTDLNAFLVQQAAAVQTVKRLVIVSVNQGVHDFRIDCDQLKHLELYSVTFTTPKILESPKLQNVYLHEAFFRQSRPKLNVTSFKNASISILLFAEIGKYLKSIKYLEINDTACSLTTKIVLPITKLNIVERVKLPEFRFDLLQSICDRFTAIKRVDYFVAISSDPFGRAFRSFLEKRKDSLKVRPFGIDPLKSAFLNKFYEKFHLLIRFDHISITLIIFEEFLLSMSRFENCLGDFFRLVTVLSIMNLPYSEVYKKMISVSELIITLRQKTMTNFNKILSDFPHMTGFKFYQDASLFVADHFINLSSLSQFNNVHRLKIAVWQAIDLGFLLKMANLKYLVLVLYQPIQVSLFLDLFRRLKYLAYLQIHL